MGRLSEEAPRYPGPGEASAPPPPSFKESQKYNASPAHFQTHFACLTLNMMDRIRLIDFPVPVFDAVKEICTTHWEKGIQRTEIYGGANEIKLGGFPWGENVIGRDPPRILMLRILEKLYNMGWVLQLTLDCIRKEQDKDSLVFRKQDPIPQPCHWLCISFDRWSKLKIVGGPPRDMSQAIVEVFGNQLKETEITDERMKVRFSDNVWIPSGEKTVQTRRKIITLVQMLERFGYSTYATLDIHNGSEGRETDVLIVHRQQGWAPGMPIWHR